MSQLVRHLSSIIVGRRTAAIIALVPIVLAVLAIAMVGPADRTSSQLDNVPQGADSTLATELAGKLPDDDTSAAIVLFATPDREKLSDTQLGELRTVLSDLGARAPLTTAEDGTAALGVVTIGATDPSELSTKVTDLRERLDAAMPDGVTAQVTGPAGIQADLAAVFEGADVRLLMVTALVVAVLLVATYRSPILWIVPLVVVGTADQLAAVLATRVMAAVGASWDESTTGILSVLVFGAGTNYALLLVSRYRDELKRHEDRREAMALALRRTAEAVTTSASTVAVGVLTLLLSLTPATRGLGIACAVGIVVAASFVLLVLPAALVCFGRWVFWPLTPRVSLDDDRDSTTSSIWRRIGDRVAARPVVWVGAAVIVLAALSAGTLRISTGLETAEQFLDKPEAIAASERIAESFPAGASEPTTVITTADAQAVGSAIAEVNGVSSVQPAGSGQNGSPTQFTVTLDSGAGTSASEDTVMALREAVESFPDTHVGGPVAESIDQADGDARDRLVILPLIVTLVLLVLIVLLRSILAPVILVLTVLATFGAALGASWWLFSGPLGFENLAGNVPLYAFLFLVALGIDYNIFLITRTLEEASEYGTREGVLRALGATGGVITSAGILLAAVFAVLGVLPLVVLAQLGVVIGIGVLLDTLLVRTIVVPAIVRLLGERFWWPRRVHA